MSFVATTLRISAGVMIWALHFAVIYGFTALACARHAPGVVPWVVGIATAAGASACLIVIGRGLARRDRFESWMSAGVAALAIVAILWEAVPIFMVPVC